MVCSAPVTCEPSPAEQLSFSFDCELPSFRLLEPLESLLLTPFAFKAAKATGASTVMELKIALSSSSHAALGRGHREEIQRKIAEFIGEIPGPIVDWGSFLRCSLSPLEPAEKAAFLVYFGLSSLCAPPTHGVKEAEAAIQRRGLDHIEEIAEKLRSRNKEKIEGLLRQVSVQFLQPFVLSQEGIVHTTELLRCVQKLGNLSYSSLDGLTNFFRCLFQCPFPFGHLFFEVTPTIIAGNREMQRWAFLVLEEAQGFVFEKADMSSVAALISRRLLSRWELCSQPLIQRVLGWYYLEEDAIRRF